jgi:2-dehydropantoate 2-reductase
MRVLVMGAGAVGGFYGWRLLGRGHAVTFVARGSHGEALARRGLEVRSHGRSEGVRPVHVVADPAAGPGPELVLFTVKGYDTEAAARALSPAVGPSTAVLTLQNGIDHPERLAAILGADRVLVGTTVLEATVAEPGIVEQGGPPPRVVLGELSGRVTRRVQSIAAALGDAGVEVRLTDDPRRALWEKFVRLAPGATLTSACQATIGALRDRPETAALYRTLVAEAVAVGAAAGAGLPADAVDTAWAWIAALPGSMKTSMQRGFERGRPVELEELTGAVVRRGAALGVPTPAFTVLYAVLKARAPGQPGGDAG